MLSAGCDLSGTTPWPCTHIFEVAFLKCSLCCFHHLPCLQITQETLLTPYLQALQRWEEVSHQHDFSAVDKKLSNTTEWVIFKIPNQFWPHVRLPLASPVVSLLQKVEATKITHPTLKKYKVFCTLYIVLDYCTNNECVIFCHGTAWWPLHFHFSPLQILPPITAAAVSDPVVPICAKRAQRRAQRAAALLMRPEPPRAALIHLEVTARSHEHLECFKHFPEQFNKLHRWNMIYSVT